MDSGALGFQPLTPVSSNSNARQAPRKDLATRAGKSLRIVGRGAKSRWTSSSGSHVDKSGRSKARTSPIGGSKPLVPAGERMSGDRDGLKLAKDTDGETPNITPDGGSAGREGRHFTVANVGNNGQIYLRPSVRPANQRYPQPHFVFPITPPSTAGLDPLAHSDDKDDESSDIHGSRFIPTPLTDASTLEMARQTVYFDYKSAPSNRHRRAMSDSTIQDVSMAQEEEAGAFKVVISKSQDEAKAKTAEDIDTDPNNFLQISIPSWKLGTPRFTLRGTPIIRGSSYAPTEDPRSSNLSSFRSAPREQNALRPEGLDSGKSSPLTPRVQLPSPGLLSPSTITSPKFPMPMRSTYMSTHLVIEPAMFDSLTFKPACDDRSIVRYSPNTNAVTAATPPRLVAEITSPSFLDYELISDFFLTFRSYLETSDLLKMLIARLRWALARDDETGMVVKVRTFVAIRHWILNYFVDDFVVDYQLRATFCNLLNDFSDELSADQPGKKVPLKILGELKKCWRRVCAQYWDGPEFESSLGPEIPIAPGGIAGHRDPSLDPSFWELELDMPPQLYGVEIPDGDSQPDHAFYADVSRAGHVDTTLLNGGRPSTPEGPSARLERQQASPTSESSVDVVSCSFPTKGLRMGDPNTSLSLGAHPVDPSSIYTYADPIASTPRALTGKRVHPHTSHRRNNSLTDSLREHRSLTERVLYKNAEFLLTLPYAGSLVRGNLLPPGQAIVDMDAPDSGRTSRMTTLFQPQLPASKQKTSASAMSGQGMKKLIGSVRRALSTKGQGFLTHQGGFLDLGALGPRGVTTNRLPGTAVVPEAARLRQAGSKQRLRIDMLGAEVAEDFQQAVREDAAEAQAEDEAYKGPAGVVAYSAAHLDSSFELRSDHDADHDAAMTTGSKSIVIVDGTMPEERSIMSGAFRAINPSVEAFAESMFYGAGNPTPPITPPGQGFGNTPRRSSFLLGRHMLDAAVSATSPPLPDTTSLLPFVPDMGTLGPGRPSEDTKVHAPPSADFLRESISKPPLSYMRQHKRQESSRSYRSKGSHRRWASFQSGMAAQSTIRSFDATSYSGSLARSEAMPPPLRVLRRRPGGDLRGATNIADLDGLPLQRSRSVGSLTTFSDSIRSSYIRSPIRGSCDFVDVVSSDYSQNRGEIFSLGAMADPAPKQPISLFSSHASKPVVPPSFEAEAQKLAQIPDDADDDGGVESALLKLEGKYQRKMAKLSMEPLKIPTQDLEDARDGSTPTPKAEVVKDEKWKHRHQHVGEDEPVISPIEEEDLPTGKNGQLQAPRHSAVSSFLSEDSRETYNSIPLLDRGVMDDSPSKPRARTWTNQSILEGPDTPEEMDATVANSPLHPSYEFVTKTDSMNKIEPGQTAPDSDKHQSFLDADSDRDSELSSELSGDIEDDEFVPSRPHPPMKDNSSPTRALPYTTAETRHSSKGGRSSPPISLRQALQMPPEETRSPQLHERQLWSQKPLPPTPDTTPTAAMQNRDFDSYSDPTGTRSGQKLNGAMYRKSSAHLPFILAFDSKVLAQQFTLIEKDALNEVDWKELIDMGWKNSTNDSRSWVDFLRNTDARGVEVVIARFNIMVKWAISEVVLTEDLEERARCIIKFIHIAAHCRRIRNFATMSQIVFALTSNEIARLSKTWAMIPPTDQKTMNDLENLVSPTKNFYNLRAEMEGGGTTTDPGCIPFVGIYTHDLLFNAQRPSEIASSPTTAPLVNFERCRIAASVVKTLLRLLEASTFYQFQPIEGITERCLWMGALSDEEIRSRSEGLE
ncbi:hypothetical protein F4809DRAFT_236676 [Biscogniauxia mediterranea]|nr:hypothetical protein F4809DRAFT_236676 [Biscogniauxia mediterranea]